MLKDNINQCFGYASIEERGICYTSSASLAFTRPCLCVQAKNKFIMLKVLKELSVKGGSAKLMDDTPTTKSLRSNKSLSTQVSGSVVGLRTRICHVTCE